MGEFNSKCALSGLPIEEGEPTLLLFLREVNSLELKDTYWATRLATGWQPLLFPIEGKYNNHGWLFNKIRPIIEQPKLKGKRVYRPSGYWVNSEEEITYSSYL